MELEYENVFYKPKLTNHSIIAIRRLSWYFKKPMTLTLEAIIENMPNMIDAKKVCQSCKIKDKCDYCIFKPK